MSLRAVIFICEGRSEQEVGSYAANFSVSVLLLHK